MYDLNTDVPTLPTFDIIADALMPLGALNSPAELHGFLCGHLCAGARFGAGDWMSMAWELLDVVQPPDRDLDDLIAELYVTTLQQIRDGNMGFMLLLPEDHYSIEQRVTALSQWCHGFLAGFGSAESREADIEALEESDPSINIEETLEDFAAFVQMQAQAEDEDEDESEGNFYEILEYVRVATLNIFMDLGIHADPTDNDKAALDDEYDDEAPLH